jgi:hypothetical protein
MSDTKHDWTHDMLVAFNDLYRATPELSFAKIAALMSSAFDITLTSNACIGKAHRLGLPKREPQPFTLDLVDLQHGDCRWPSGAPMARPPFFYCGAPAVAGRPYCAVHMDVAHSHWVRT